MRSSLLLGVMLSVAVSPALAEETTKTTAPSPKYLGTKVVTKPLVKQTATTGGTTGPVKTTVVDDPTLVSPSQVLRGVGTPKVSPDAARANLDALAPRVPIHCELPEGKLATEPLYSNLARLTAPFKAFKVYAAEQRETDPLDYVGLATAFINAPSLQRWNTLLPFLRIKGQRVLNLGGLLGGGSSKCIEAFLANFDSRIGRGTLKAEAAEVKRVVMSTYNLNLQQVTAKILEWQYTDEGAKRYPRK